MRNGSVLGFGITSYVSVHVQTPAIFPCFISDLCIPCRVVCFVWDARCFWQCFELAERFSSDF